MLKQIIVRRNLLKFLNEKLKIQNKLSVVYNNQIQTLKN